MIEVIGPSKRAFAGTMTHVYYAFGYMASSGLGYLLPDWRGFTMGIATLTALTFLTLPFYPESPRFLYGRDR